MVISLQYNKMYIAAADCIMLQNLNLGSLYNGLFSDKIEEADNKLPSFSCA